MHDGGVVAATKTAANFGQRPICHMFGQIHRHLPGPGIAAHALGADQIGQADVEMVADLALNLLNGDLAVAGAQDVGQTISGQFQRNVAAHQRRKGKQPGQRPFEHADVG